MSSGDSPLNAAKRAIRALLVCAVFGSRIVHAGDYDRFEVAPPVWKVIDQPVAKAPAERESNTVGDSAMTLLTRRVDRALGVKDESLAKDINSLDEVPDSAWYQARVGTLPITPEDVFWGPSARDGSSAPVPGDTLTVTAAKVIGFNPGFIAKDSRGGRYVVKFDPPSDPEMQTAADAIGSRLAWALGYHVPQDNLFVFRRESLKIKPGIEVVDHLTGKKRPMTEADLDSILGKASRNDDGSFRCLLSRFIPGTPIGSNPQEGTRKDDPNDRISHEDRRSMRAWRAFGAWIKHTDLKEDNTLDAYVTEDGKSFVRHYFIDFGEIFAAQAGENEYYRDGFEYSVDPWNILLTTFSFGLWIHPWEHVKETGIRGIGPFGPTPFEFYKWKTLRPNRFVNRMTPIDGFWAVRKLYALTDDHMAAAIRAGQFTDPRAAPYLLDTLKQRRATIAREVLDRVNPAATFQLLDNGSALGFEDFAVRVGLAEAGSASWRIQLVVLRGDDATAGPKLEVKESRVALGAPPPPGQQLVVRIQTLRAGKPVGEPTHVHIAQTPDAGLRIIGIDRWRTGSF